MMITIKLRQDIWIESSNLLYKQNWRFIIQGNPNPRGSHEKEVSYEHTNPDMNNLLNIWQSGTRSQCVKILVETWLLRPKDCIQIGAIKHSLPSYEYIIQQNKRLRTNFNHHLSLLARKGKQKLPRAGIIAGNIVQKKHQSSSFWGTQRIKKRTT